MPESKSVNYEIDPAARAVIQGAYDLVEAKYGPSGKSPRGYHNLAHTTSVVEAAALLADAAIANGKILPHDKRLIVIAAAYHDTEQDLGSGPNEQESVQLAIADMRSTGEFSQTDEKAVSDMIMATQVHFDGEGRMSQSCTDDYRTQIVADADLASLGRPVEVYLQGVEGLFREFNPGVDIESPQGLRFLKGQVAFVSNHVFYTPEAAQLFPGEAHNGAYIQNLLDQVA